MRIGLKATEGCFKSNSTIILSLALKKPSLQRVVTRFVLIPLSPGAKYEFYEFETDLFLRLFTPVLSLKFQVAGYMQLGGGKLYSLEVLGQFRFLGNCPPTPPLSQHFALIEK